MVKYIGILLIFTFCCTPAYASVNNLILHRSLAALLIIAAYLVFCFWILARHRKNHKIIKPLIAAGNSLSSSILVAYASQTGFALQLARQTVQLLETTGIKVQLIPLDTLNIDMLTASKRILFIVSTTGEGDAPNNATTFVHTVMQRAIELPQLKYALLALGDSSYTHYCSFGRKLNTWLQHIQASPFFNMIEVDNFDTHALHHWQSQLNTVFGSTEVTDWRIPYYQPWQLIYRQHLNPGSIGAPVYHLGLITEEPNIDWQAGDIAEIRPRNSYQDVLRLLKTLGLAENIAVDNEGITLLSLLQERLLPYNAPDISELRGLSPNDLIKSLPPLPSRSYSIASLPQDGRLELVVRRTQYPNGKLGLGSGWLTRFTPIGSKISLRIRTNPSFHPQTTDTPLILIGNGTGIAGLYAHLKARIANGYGRNWLIFGERNSDYDFYFREELRYWQQQGMLVHLDTAFSRDQEKRIYVQNIIQRLAAKVKHWVFDEGAAIYICGSANYMAPAVHRVLIDTLGKDTLAKLTISGHYRRDIY